MTITEIKYKTLEKCPYFFTRDTLRFFGQTMRSFKIKTSPAGNIYIYAPSYWGARLMGYTFRQFKDNDLLLLDCDKSESDIIEYIKNN